MEQEQFPGVKPQRYRVRPIGFIDASIFSRQACCVGAPSNCRAWFSIVSLPWREIVGVVYFAEWAQGRELRAWLCLVDGMPNLGSFGIAAAWRACRALGYQTMICWSDLVPGSKSTGLEHLGGKLFRMSTITAREELKNENSDEIRAIVDTLWALDRVSGKAADVARVPVDPGRSHGGDRGKVEGGFTQLEIRGAGGRWYGNF